MSFGNPEKITLHYVIFMNLIKIIIIILMNLIKKIVFVMSSL